MKETDPVEPVRESGSPPAGRTEGGSRLRARLDGLDGGRAEASDAPPAEWRDGETIDVRTDLEAGETRTEPLLETATPESRLSDAERAAVQDYTGFGYADLNDGLRKGSVSPEQSARAEALSSALAKMPPFEGEVYRGANIDPQIAERYRVGAVVAEDAFTSTSRSLPFQGKNTYWTIQSRNGRDISAVSVLPSEEEVLFDRGSRFRIVQNFEYDGKRYIEMEEVD